MKRRSFLTALAGVPILGRLVTREVHAEPEPAGILMSDLKRRPNDDLIEWPDKLSDIRGYDESKVQCLGLDAHGYIFITAEKCD